MMLLRPLHPLLRPLYFWWTRKERRVRIDGLDLLVAPGVFHPTFFHSTGTLVRYIQRLPLRGRSFLELGAGAGRVSLVAARAGAVVTASDINTAAITCLKRNAQRNALPIRVVNSDLFAALPDHFEVIVINPPYYEHEPQDARRGAFFSGEGHRYFHRLFPALAERIDSGSEVHLVLSADPRLSGIHALAARSGLHATRVHAERHWGEEQVVFRLARSRAHGG